MSTREKSACEHSHLIPDYAFDELDTRRPPRRGTAPLGVRRVRRRTRSASVDYRRAARVARSGSAAAYRICIGCARDRRQAAEWVLEFDRAAGFRFCLRGWRLALSFAASHRQQPVVVSPVATVSDATIQQVVDKAVAVAVDKAHAEDIQITKAALDAVDSKYALKQRDLMVAMQETMADERKRLDLGRVYAMSYDTPRMGAGQ